MERTKSPVRLGWVDAGRGVAILLVVLYHSANWLAVPPWQDFNTLASTLRMPLFFAISGSFAHKHVQGAWHDLWHSKLSLFIWVTVLWTIIGSFALDLGLQVQGTPYSWRSALHNILESPFKPRLELWFLWALVLFFVISKLLRAVHVWLVLAVAGILSAAALGGMDLGNTGWNGAVRYYFFFACGLHLRELIFRWADSARRGQHAMVLVGWMAMSVLVETLGLEGVPLVHFANCLLGLWAGVSLSTQLSGVGWLRKIGQRTLPIYLAHTPLVLVIAFTIWTMSGDPSPGQSGPLLVPAVSGICVLTALLLQSAAVRLHAGWLYEAPRRVATPLRQRISQR